MFLSLTPLKYASSVCQARRRPFTMSKIISGEISRFWKLSWLRFAHTRKEHDFLKSLKHELFIIMKISG